MLLNLFTIRIIKELNSLNNTDILSFSVFTYFRQGLEMTHSF